MCCEAEPQTIGCIDNVPIHNERSRGRSGSSERPLRKLGLNPTCGRNVGPPALEKHEQKKEKKRRKEPAWIEYQRVNGGSRGDKNKPRPTFAHIFPAGPPPAVSFCDPYRSVCTSLYHPSWPLTTQKSVQPATFLSWWHWAARSRRRYPGTLWS